MKLHRKTFFDNVRESIFKGRLSLEQVQGTEILLDAWEEFGTQDHRHLAYILATAYHETAYTMQPIDEYGKGRGRPYGQPAGPYGLRYYGRGFVQLTWLRNYEVMSEVTGIDLVRFPDRAKEPAIAARIIIEGMLLGHTNRGDFTGLALEHFINSNGCDYVGARKTVNGTDRATTIAGYAIKFERAIVIAREAYERERDLIIADLGKLPAKAPVPINSGVLVEDIVEVKPAVQSKTTVGGTAASVSGFALLMVAFQALTDGNVSLEDVGLLFAALASLIGGVAAIIGRFKANSIISGIFRIK